MNHRIILILGLLINTAGYAQYILNGSAEQISCNCYTLTQPTHTQSGSVWNENKISLATSFDFWFNVYLGCIDANGADGIVFMLQPISTSVGATGGGLGFQGVSPSIGITLDTYQNFDVNDPDYDHIAIQVNGNLNHNNDLDGPVAISSLSGNVEDCNWHKLRISWDASAKILRAYFDGILRVEAQNDIVASIFNNDPNVYWGFSGATGGSINLQQFCTALDPDFLTDSPDDVFCAPATVTFNNQSESFAPIANYTWDFGNGSSSSDQYPSPQVYTNAGTYDVKLTIEGMDGCENDTIKTITVGSVPDADMTINDVCFSNDPTIQFESENFGVSYEWLVDGIVVGNGPAPVLNNLSTGSHELQLIATSLHNCGSPDINTHQFVIKPLPQIELSFSQVCRTLTFSGNQINIQPGITSWNWNFGDNTTSLLQNPVHTYDQQGQYTVNLSALADNGCSSDTISTVMDIPDAFAFAGNDTIVIKGTPFQLQGDGNGSFEWEPAFALSDPFIADPVATLNQDQEYQLTVTTPEGCIETDEIKIKVYEGPAIYVPGAFTPNGDGLNDRLRPVYVGIIKLGRFAVYNRWGQLVFTTNDMSNGWDGTIQQKVQASGTYVWFVKAVNHFNQPIVLKGTVTIIQ